MSRNFVAATRPKLMNNHHCLLLFIVNTCCYSSLQLISKCSEFSDTLLSLDNPMKNRYDSEHENLQILMIVPTINTSLSVYKTLINIKQYISDRVLKKLNYSITIDLLPLLKQWNYKSPLKKSNKVQTCKNCFRELLKI